MAKTTTRLADDLIATAHEMADAARAAILPHFRAAGLTAETKAEQSFDPVTIADRAAETAMRAVLAERRPADAIFGEEHGASAGSSGLTWVLDPIDGTRGFVAGTPTWGVLIAVGDDTGPQFGIVDQPYIGERFAGGFGVAEMSGPLGTRPLGVRTGVPLSEALIFTTFPEVGTSEEGAAFHRVARHCRLTRYGMDCYAYALLAAGHVDLVIEAGLHIYDIQGPLAVIQAAGGIVTNWQGGPAHEGGQVVAAASQELHQDAMKLLNGA